MVNALQYASLALALAATLFVLVLVLRRLMLSRSSRDTMIEMQMVEGLNESLDRLAEHLATAHVPTATHIDTHGG